MIRRVSINSVINLANAGGVCGWLLLIRPLIYLMFSRRRDLNAYSSVDSSAVVFIFYAVFCFFFSLRALQKKESFFARDLLKRSPLFWFLVYTIFGIISVLWSVNPQLTGFRAFECLSMAMLMVSVTQSVFINGSCRLAIQWTLLYVTVDIIFSLLRALSYTTNIMELLQTSQMMATTFFYIALFQSPKRLWNYLIIVMSIFSMSTVAYIGMALGSICTFFGHAKYKVLVFFASLILGTTVAVIGPYNFLKNTVFFDKKTISIHETTGRDKIMDVAFQALEERPQGYGFFAGEPFLLYSKNLGAINGHNSFFSAAIGLGIPGIVLISLFFIMMCKIAFSRHINSEYRASLIGCFLVSFLQSMGNPGIGSRVFGGWLPTMYATVLICGFYVYGKYYEEIQYNNNYDE